MEYWEPTQRVLQGESPIVRRPKLTETLLKKPPFRFLHDVISELCRQTGFARGLFSPEELISTNIKEKETKVDYLWKIIDCVGITLNTNVPVRPLKIVAGLEPEQTNVFLQMLAAATMVDKQESEKAVVRVLAGEKQPSSSHSGLEWIQLISNAMSAQDAASEQPHQYVEAEYQTTQAKDKHLLSPHMRPDGNTKMEVTAMEIGDAHQALKISNTNFEPVLFASSGQEQLAEQSLKTSESKPSHSDVNLMSTLGSSIIPEPEFTATPHAVPGAIYNFSMELPPAVPPRPRSKDSTTKKLRQSRPAPAPGSGSNHGGVKQSGPTDIALLSPHAAMSVGDSSLHFPENPRSGSAAPSSRETQEIRVAEDAVAPAPPVCTTPRLRTPAVFPTTSSLSGQRPHSARPQSARKAPPVIRSILDKGGAKDVQGMLLERPASARISGMEVPTFVPVRKPSILLDAELSDDEQENMPILLPPPNIQETTVLTTVEGAGKLVRDILENKADLSEQGEQGEKIDGVEETGIILGQIRGSSSKKGDIQSRKEEIQKLREAVQNLCQIVNPLGKSIDHLQEDADIMDKEYQFWINERETYNIRVEEEKRITEEMLQAESGRVLELDEEIKQQNQRIISFKAQILRNDETITKLLRMVTSKTTRSSFSHEV